MKEKKLNDILTSLRRTADTMEITYKLSSLKEDFNNITKPAILEYAPSCSIFNNTLNAVLRELAI